MFSMRPLIALAIFLLPLQLLAANKAPDPVQVVSFSAEITEPSAGDFMKDFDIALSRHPKQIIVELNSIGGLITEGVEMSKVIERSPVPVTCIVDGEADSMAVYILESCKYRYITRRSLMMAHEPLIGEPTGGNEWHFMNYVEGLRRQNLAMATHIAGRVGMSTDDYMLKIHNREWWMSADEALANKFVDGIYDSVIGLYDAYQAGVGKHK